ncbi:hypothetical protein [Methyloglobulus sp.]
MARFIGVRKITFETDCQGQPISHEDGSQLGLVSVEPHSTDAI